MKPLLGTFAAWTILAACARADDESLIGHWKLDGPGQSAKDSSGGGHDGTIVGATATEGIVSGAMRFDGEDDCVTLGDLGQFENVTIAFWMKADDAAGPGGWQGLLSSDQWEEGVLHVPYLAPGPKTAARGAPAIDVYLHLGESRRGRLVSSRLKSETWYHVAIVADKSQSEIRLYLNGMEEDADDISALSTPIKLVGQVIGREFDGNTLARHFRGVIDDARIYGRALASREIRALCPDAVPLVGRDPRNIRTGKRIPDEGYCDQPYTVVTKDGNWLCTMTTGPGREGQHGQHIVAAISSDRGDTWSKLIDIEPSDGPEASWVMPLVVPSGRVYGFYTYNGDELRTWEGKPIRTDTVGWYCYKYSDDNGRTWSEKRYRLPLPLAMVDCTNTFNAKHQIFWGIGKPITHGDTTWFAFSRCGQLVVDKSEGWFYRSDNILSEPDPDRIQWQLLPDGDRGLRNLDYSDVHAEQNIVALDDGSLYCMYRTRIGYPFHAYSRDGGHSWTKPIHATYTPGGRKMKTPRACPRIWRTQDGRFLFWYHNHSNDARDGWTHRNPAWISGGIEKDGFIHWSQPEILLYDTNPEVRISYPDLIQQDGRYWITETQKTIARVHEIDKGLLEDLWSQGQRNTAAREGLVLELDAKQLEAGEVDLPSLDVESSGGVSLDFWLRLDDLSAGQVIVDSRLPEGPGLALVTGENGAVRIELSDGVTKASWDSDPVLEAGKLHHVAAIVDAGPGIISFIVDGTFCDGGDFRKFGWGRYQGSLGKVSGSGKLRIAPSLQGKLELLRIYGRYLRTSEVVANYHAGLTTAS